MSPSWDPQWLFAAGLAACFVVAAFFHLRRRAADLRAEPRLRPGQRLVTFNGPPITPQMHQLLDPFGSSTVTGIVQLREGLQVSYENGMQLTFVPVHTGGVVRSHDPAFDLGAYNVRH